MKVHLETLVVVFGTLIVLALALNLAGCTSTATPTAAGGKVRVVVSILPQAYFVERIGGDRVEVTVMVPPGASPATYEPTAGQMRDLSQADVYVRIRVPFEEAWMDKIAAANPGMLIVDSSAGIERIGGKDPHIWLSPRLVKVQAENIYQGLIEVDPEHAGFYAQNKEQFVADLDALDAEIAETLAGVKGKKFMVFHPAWSYFARDYGLEQIPVEVEGKEPSAAELAELIETAKTNDIEVIFVSPQFSTRSAETIARQIGGKVVFVDPLARDWMNNLRSVARTLAQEMKEK
ncbi:MAG: zinc ABC transporter substrate-binding protein [Chloroflexi bacterium]|nr:MAG: zinc ABC transporter substrate-binding protein [Chloroflexota bacterium]RLC92506.1 MAG: zinc ABC transporter substrate-binding protein [Chloroflexota bacterium]